jgi:hypothetical protein
MAHATQERQQPVKPSNRPVHTIRYGAIQAAVWRNIVDNGNASRPMYSVTFSRSYRDGNEKWKDSASFGVDDLLLVAKVADEVHSWIAHQKSADANGSN